MMDVDVVLGDTLRTPLHIICMYKPCVGRVKVLLRAGATVDAEDIDRSTPLLLACQTSARLAVLSELVNAGADPDHRDANGDGVLEYAARTEDIEYYYAVHDLLIPEEEAEASDPDQELGDEVDYDDV